MGVLVNKVTDGMGAKTKSVTVLGVLLLLCGTYAAPSWMEHHYHAAEAEAQSAQHKADMDLVRDAMHAQAEALKQSTENQIIMTKALAEQPKLGEVRKQASNATNEIMRQSSEADAVQLQGVRLSGVTVRALTGKKRRSGENQIIQGVFRVVTADSSGPSGFVCKVLRVSDNIIIQASMTDALMAAEDQERIQSAFWNKTPIFLSMSVRKIGDEYKPGKITKATNVAQAQVEPKVNDE